MEVCQSLTQAANFSCHAIQQLEHKLAALRQQNNPIQRLEDYENELHRLFAQAEQDVLAEDLSGLDINLPAVKINGICYHRALRCSETYQTAVAIPVHSATHSVSTRPLIPVHSATPSFGAQRRIGMELRTYVRTLPVFPLSCGVTHPPGEPCERCESAYPEWHPQGSDHRSVHVSARLAFGW